MPADKNKIRRYQEYDKFLSNFHVRYSREKILWELNETLREEGFDEVSASTVNHDISENGNFVRDMCPAVDVVSYYLYKSEDTFDRYSSASMCLEFAD